MVARAILHVDMDAFYASIEERDCPALAGKSVVVGGTPAGRGVVAAANYEARKYGIHSAMPAAQAKRLCRHAVFLRPRHSYYASVSRQIRAICQRYTPLVEPLSLDEAFLDVTDSQRLFGTAATIGRRIKQEISAELSLSASVGVAPNKFLAKIASDLQKPNGFVVVDPQRVQAFLDPLPISRLWGIGKVSTGRLQRIAIHTIGELRRLAPQQLLELFGKNGEHVWRLAHGIDERPVVSDHRAKSLSHETTFDSDINERAALRAWLLELTQQVSRRLRQAQLRGRTVHLKVRFGNFHTITRARTIAEPSNITRELWHVAVELLESNLPPRHAGVRLLGMGVSGFAAAAGEQGQLFDDTLRDKHSRVDGLSDTVNERFGAGALLRGTDLQRLR